MKLLIAQIIKSDKLPQTRADQDTLNTVLTIVFVTIGALAVLIMVIAGIRYITAQGEPAKMAEAKNMIIYSLIGLVIAASAWAIVNFVLGKV